MFKSKATGETLWHAIVHHFTCPMCRRPWHLDLKWLYRNYTQKWPEEEL